MEKKENVKKIKKKLKGDYGYNFDYFNGNNHLAKDCMLKNKEEKKEKEKNKAYYAMKLEEIHAQTKNLYLVAKGYNDEEGTYQIWSSRSNDEEMRNPNHRVIFAKHVKVHSGEKNLSGESGEDSGMEEMKKEKKEEEMIIGNCFVTTAPRSPITEKVCDLIDS